MTQTPPDILFDGSVMISETDLSGRIIFCNRKFAQMHGYDKEELLGKSHNFLRHPEMPQAIFTKMWETIQNGDTWKGYVKNLCKDGGSYWAIVIITPTHHDDGTPKGYIAVREAPGPQTLEQVKQEYASMLEAEER